MTRDRDRAFQIVAALMVFGLTAFPQVVAQGKDYSKFTISGSVGLSNPLGGMSDLFKTGYVANFNGGYNFSKKLGIVVQYDYNRLGIDDVVVKTLRQLGTGEQVAATGKVWAITGNPIIRLNRPGKVNFYGIGGAGIYQRRLLLSITTAKGTSSATQVSTGFGINFGGGATFDVGKGLKGFVEARYHHAFTRTGKNSPSFTKDWDTQMLPISVGVRW